MTPSAILTSSISLVINRGQSDNFQNKNLLSTGLFITVSPVSLLDAVGEKGFEEFGE